MPSSGDAKKLSRRVARHELIGLVVEVQSPHTGWDALVGRIVDETKHTFVVERAPVGPEVVVPKRGQTFLFRVGDVRALVRGERPGLDEQEFVAIQGDEIMFQPEDRTKKIKG